MDRTSRNLMILYAIIAFFSIAGVALNIIPIFNLKTIEDPKLTQEMAEGMTKGFYILAFVYLLIALSSIGAIIKKRFSKTLLILLTMLLLTTFVFGSYIFDFLLGNSTFEASFKN